MIREKRSMATFCCLFFLFCLLVQISQGFNIFSPSFSYAPLFLFRENKLYEVSEILGLNRNSGTEQGIWPIALGDFNSDKYTDLFVVDCNGKCLKVWLWIHYGWKYEVDEKATIELDDQEGFIKQGIVGDYNRDGMLDIVIVTTTNDKKNRFFLYLGNNNVFTRSRELTEVQARDQVLVMDANSDMSVDFFGTSITNDSSTSHKRVYWINKTPSSSSQTYFEQEEQKIEEGKYPSRPLVYSSVSSLVDINGDCAADLVLVSCDSPEYIAEPGKHCQSPIIEIWLNVDGKFKLDQILQAYRGMGRLQFSDFNRDGNLDMMYHVCDPIPTCSKVNEIHIIENQQKPMCGVIASRNCRSQTDLCQPSEYKFDIDNPSKTPLNNIYLANFTIQDTYFEPIIALGDYNLDTYEDIMITAFDSALGKKKVQLLKNIPCVSPLDGNNPKCSEQQIKAKSHFFEPENFGVDDLTKTIPPNKQPYTAFFVDFDETGLVDIVVLLEDLHGKNRSMMGFYNNLFNDAFFFKTMGLNGISEVKSQKPYGAILPGTTFKFTATDVYGEKHPRISTQYSQSAYMSLQTPYHLFGLGRTNGFIEEFFMGITLTKNNELKNNLWQGIIPNSQLIIVPYPPEKPESWEMELFVDPGGHTLFVAIGVVASLILLGIPIVILQLWDRKKDKEEQRKSTGSLRNVFIG